MLIVRIASLIFSTSMEENDVSNFFVALLLNWARATHAGYELRGPQIEFWRLYFRFIRISFIWLRFYEWIF